MPTRKKSVKPEVVQPAPIIVQQNNNVLYIFLALLVVGLGFMFYKMTTLEKQLTLVTNTGTTNQQAPPPPTTVSIDKVRPLFGSGYMHFGDAKSKLLFVEVSDPSCPYCHIAGGQDASLAKSAGPNFQYNTDGGTYDPPLTEMRKLVDQGKASYVQLYAPGHGNGILAAQALYCAYDKGKFWEVHDKLMSDAGYNLENNDVKNDMTKLPQLVDFLSGVIDGNYLSQCIQSGKYAKTLDRDTQLAQTIGYQGTPHFIVNTTIYPGAVSFSDMKSVVDKSL